MQHILIQVMVKKLQLVTFGVWMEAIFASCCCCGATTSCLLKSASSKYWPVNGPVLAGGWWWPLAGEAAAAYITEDLLRKTKETSVPK